MEIEKGIPFEDGRTASITKYPWARMEVGDSFLVPDRTQKAMGGCARYHAKRLGRKYKAAKVQDGVRVWRLA